MIESAESMIRNLIACSQEILNRLDSLLEKEDDDSDNKSELKTNYEVSGCSD
jgi:hypothetical protein